MINDDITKVLINKLIESNERLGRVERELLMLSEENNKYRHQLGLKKNNPFLRICSKPLKSN